MKYLKQYQIFYLAHGLVSTSSITHATPASFFAHTISRDFEDEIALQLAKSEVDYFAGGGMNFFENRKDNINVIDTLKSNGFSVKLDRLDIFDNIEIEAMEDKIRNKFGIQITPDDFSNFSSHLSRCLSNIDLIKDEIEKFYESNFGNLKKVVDKGVLKLKNGFSVILFPEGTRISPEKGIQPFANSCGVLASKSGRPILPICHNSGKYWKNKRFIKRPGQVTVKIGTPITGNNAKELTENAYLWIKNSYREIS